ncbi:MAG: GtrA family protein [Maridesulfovibrio sp.]
MTEQASSQNKTGKIFSTWDIKGTIRFLRYTCVGGGTFLFDLALLYILTDGFNWPPAFAAGLAFLIAVSVNYLISRRLVFKGTAREFRQGYFGFLLIAGTGLIIVTGGMFLMVDILHGQYFICRILISLITGLWNYILNLYVNFRVAGKPLL